MGQHKWSGPVRRLAPTAIAAYREIQPTLCARQCFVRSLLEAFHAEYDTWPTAKELLRFPVARYVEARAIDPNSVRPRLFELHEQGYVAHGPKRRCCVTGKTVVTWQVATPRPPVLHGHQLEIRF
jgi:hypothetical protein